MAYDLIITGPRHSGTKELARILTLAGASCHELKTKRLTFDDCFRAKDCAHSSMFVGHYFNSKESFRQQLIYDSIVSEETIVILVTRHPIHSILKLRSMYLNWDEKLILAKYGVDIDVYDNELDRAACYYIAWFWLSYELCKASTCAVYCRLENLTMDEIRSFVGLLGIDANDVKLPHYDCERVGKIYIKNKGLKEELDKLITFIGY